ncbi:hypothetical protein [Halocella sp. SP3-1]|uniref:hypothetical protein n=1 Tax=Halocella sp. SP3-1 TaxID=2382161 RepID=UPI0013DECCBB|nr:hypothetical protein [Halocella sp. SP3-1]
MLIAGYKKIHGEEPESIPISIFQKQINENTYIQLGYEKEKKRTFLNFEMKF